jgi:hypothetical protein
MESDLIKLEQRLKEIETTTESLRQEKSIVEAQIRKIHLSKDITEYESGQCEFDPQMSVDELRKAKFGWKQLRYIVYKIHGTGVTYPHRHWQVSIFSRSYTTGDVSYHEYTDEQYARLLMIFLEEQGCRYCKQIGHCIEKCPKKEKLYCKACLKKGHTIAKCRDLAALQKYHSPRK